MVNLESRDREVSVSSSVEEGLLLRQGLERKGEGRGGVPARLVPHEHEAAVVGVRVELEARGRRRVAAETNLNLQRKLRKRGVLATVVLGRSSAGAVSVTLQVWTSSGKFLRHSPQSMTILTLWD